VHSGNRAQETWLVLRLALRQRLYLGCKCHQFRGSTFFIQKASRPFTRSCLVEYRLLHDRSAFSRIKLSPLATISVGKSRSAASAPPITARNGALRTIMGRLIYGGSYLACVRGGWSELEGIYIGLTAFLGD
jgi:hypothetical protein